MFCSIFSGWYVMAPCEKKDAKSKQIDDAIKNNKVYKKCFCPAQVLSEFANECEYKNQALQKDCDEASCAQIYDISLKLSN